MRLDSIDQSGILIAFSSIENLLNHVISILILNHSDNGRTHLLGREYPVNDLLALGWITVYKTLFHHIRSVLVGRKLDDRSNKVVKNHRPLRDWAIIDDMLDDVVSVLVLAQGAYVRLELVE